MECIHQIKSVNIQTYICIRYISFEETYLDNSQQDALKGNTNFVKFPLFPVWLSDYIKKFR